MLGRKEAPGPESHEYLTTREAARLLRVQPQSLRRWRCEGRGPQFVKVGPSRVLYRRATIENYLAEREFVSTADQAAVAALRNASLGS